VKILRFCSHRAWQTLLCKYKVFILRFLIHNSTCNIFSCTVQPKILAGENFSEFGDCKRCFTEFVNPPIRCVKVLELVVKMDLNVAANDVEFPSLFKMTRAQQERSERNRLKAKALQQSRLTRKHPYTKPTDDLTSNSSSQGPSSQQFTDTGGGFILEAEDIDKLSGHVIISSDEGKHTWEWVIHGYTLAYNGQSLLRMKNLEIKIN